MHLLADESEPSTEFEQEALNVIDERLLDLALPSWITRADEVEEIRVFENLRGEIRVRRRKSERKIVLRLSAALMGLGFDLQRQNGMRPAVLHCMLRIPKPLLGRFELVQQSDVLIPANLCKGLLHNCSIRPRSSKGTHVFEVTRRESAHVRKGAAQVCGQAVDDLCAPALSLLAGQDGTAHIPIGHHHRRIGRQHGAQACLGETALDLAEKTAVTLRHVNRRSHGSELRILAGTTTSDTRRRCGDGSLFGLAGGHGWK